MKKRIIYIILVACLCVEAKAQTISEWVRQKKTQKKYLLQQIAALQVYLGYMNNGYSIARKGLTFIENLKNGDLSLHRDNFNKLVTVNPAILKSNKVKGIISLQLEIATICQKSKRNFSITSLLQNSEKKYVDRIYNTLLTECLKAIGFLYDLLSNDRLSMSDDERVKWIDELYEDFLDKRIFIKSFTDHAKGLLQQRKRESADIIMSKKLNALP